MAANFDEIILFVAKSIDQQTCYKLLEFNKFKFVKKEGLVFAELESLMLTLNENYIVLLAGILEQHLEDFLNLQRNN